MKKTSAVFRSKKKISQESHLTDFTSLSLLFILLSVSVQAYAINAYMLPWFYVHFYVVLHIAVLRLEILVLLLYGFVIYKLCIHSSRRINFLGLLDTCKLHIHAATLYALQLTPHSILKYGNFHNCKFSFAFRCGVCVCVDYI